MRAAARGAVLLIAGLLGVSHVAGAQTDTGRAAPPAGRGRAGGRVGMQVPRGLAAKSSATAGNVQPMDSAQRQEAIRLVRAAMNRAYRNRLDLNNQQMRALMQTQQRYERQRQELLKGERQTRQGLIAAIRDTTAPPDQAKIAGYIEQLTQSQHRQADLIDAEQKELSTFLTPLQRAQYIGLKEQFDKKIQQLRQQNPAPPAVKADTIPR